MINDIKDTLLYYKYLGFSLLCPLIFFGLKNEFEKLKFQIFLKSLAIFSLLIGLAQIIALFVLKMNSPFLGQQIMYHVRPTGTFAEPTYFSVFATLFLPFFLKENKFNKKEIYEFIIYFSLLLINLIFSQTRTSILMLFYSLY